MKRALMMAALGTLIFAIGCSSLTVRHDYDLNADFDAYRTYGWIEQAEDAGGGAQEATTRSSLLDQRVKAAVEAELQARGLTRSEDNPDLLLAYHTGVDERINVVDWGYTYGRTYWGYYDRNIDVQQYQEGTLIVDLVDNTADQLVWRGIAQKTLDDNPTPEQSERTIQEAVQKMFEKYPPPELQK